MGDPLDAILRELEQFGKANDASRTEHRVRMLNITRDTGAFLAVLVRATLARSVLEIGTSNGYSTLWLASAACAIGGLVTTVESSEYKIAMASQNFERAGLSRCISLVHDDAGCLLNRRAEDEFDFIFVDADRREYTRWWPRLRRVLRPSGLLVIDNATSHPDEIAPLASLINADISFSKCVVPIGNGEFLAVRDR